MKRCQCKPGCKAKVKTADAIYAHGHNPAFWGRSRLHPEAQTMTGAEYEAFKKRLKAEHGPYATAKKLTKCLNGCGFCGGVREMRRHMAACVKRAKQ